MRTRVCKCAGCNVRTRKTKSSRRRSGYCSYCWEDKHDIGLSETTQKMLHGWIYTIDTGRIRYVDGTEEQPERSRKERPPRPMKKGIRTRLRNWWKSKW